MTQSNIIEPNWDVPSQVKALVTTRIGGHSKPPYASWNLAAHVGDDIADVELNRKTLIEAQHLPQPPTWLTQVHGTEVLRLPHQEESAAPEADVAYTNQAGILCSILTADCLPVLFTNESGTEVAAAHAGWKGLYSGVLEASVKQFESAPHKLKAWLGPAIGPSTAEVGEELRQYFLQWSQDTEEAFTAAPEGKWLANIYQLATILLNNAGVREITGGEYCTYSDPEHFFSYRRDGDTGRMASIIWFS